MINFNPSTNFSDHVLEKIAKHTQLKIILLSKMEQAVSLQLASERLMKSLGGFLNRISIITGLLCIVITNCGTQMNSGS